MDRFVIAGNWKMHMTKEEMKLFFDRINHYEDINLSKNILKIICPVYPLLTYAIDEARMSNIMIGAQNVSQHDKGAFTGEVSAAILKSVSIDYCIIGHSERRQYFDDTNEVVRLKWMQLRAEKINPIICIGETLEERESGDTFTVLDSQIGTIFSEMDMDADEDIMLAYEPVWAIGTGKTATPQIAQETHRFIREKLVDIYGDKAKMIPLLYGGSVKPSNIKDLLTQEDINGALIGGASLKPDDFAEMINITGELLKNA